MKGRSSSPATVLWWLQLGNRYEVRILPLPDRRAEELEPPWQGGDEVLEALTQTSQRSSAASPHDKWQF